MCSTHFKLSCRIILALPTCNSFVQFVFAQSLYSLPGGLLLRLPWCWLLLFPLQFIRTGLIQILDFGYLRPWCFMQEVFILYFLLVFSLLYTNALKSAQFNRYLQPFESFPQNWVITEVFVGPLFYPSLIYCTGKPCKFSLFPIFFLCLSFLPSILQYCCVMDHACQLHNSFVRLDY